MIVTVDSRSATPPFEQVRIQVIDLIRSGALVAGTRLPTVRRLAADLGIAPNTVARAYKELEAAGYITTRGRAGSFVEAKSGTAEDEALSAARAYVDRIRELGLSADEAVAFITAVLSKN
ncbi:GntR family transcriptional regulator [Leifsonia kafniensis]|uniref:GntR family transcriptional regulator n=1 Tax=Leifsonia kafniensis TaxID=475957 RepID=A0ABP7L0Z4_9MICO